MSEDVKKPIGPRAEQWWRTQETQDPTAEAVGTQHPGTQTPAAEGSGGTQHPGTQQTDKGAPALDITDAGANDQPYRPANWQEAVRDHFAPREDSDKTPGDLRELIDLIRERRAAIHLPTKADLERERRRKRTSSIISGIADAASAVANLIYTTKDSPGIPQGNLMTDKTRERYERIRKQHDADADQFLNYSLMINKLRDAQEAKEYQRGRDALQDQLAQLKAAHNAKLSDIKYKRISQQIDDAQAAVEIREADRELERKIKEATLDEIQSRTRKNDRYVPGNRGGGGRGGGGKGYAVYDKDGNVVGRESKQVDAAKRSIDNGYAYPTQVTVSENRYGEKRRTEKSFNVAPKPESESGGAGARQNNSKKKVNKLGL